MPTAHGKHALSEAPDTFVIGQLAELYQPVQFNHKLHADMAEMGGNCETCHHYSPEGRIPPCSECHGGEANPINLRQPSLKGAYHRQCMSCHREWSHDTQCVLCHLPVAGKTMAPLGFDSTDIMGISHPVIVAPVTKLYHTKYPGAGVVTFHHEEHVELFGIQCATCHRQENCSYCHNLQRPADQHKSVEQLHAICTDCHEICETCPPSNECMHCHDSKEKPAFSHAQTGWPMNRFHTDLGCRTCHPTGKPIAALNRNCDNCHGGWNQSTFTHAIVGLQLDELHGEMDCSDCHNTTNYSAEPNCSGCHDDGRTAKDFPPGEYVEVPK